MNVRLKASGRAGHYVTQPTGYKAFIPNGLPPHAPDLQIDADMQALLSDADRALGRLDGSIQTLPNPDLFVLMYVRKEAVLSSQIEGTQSSLADILKAEAHLFEPNRPNDVREVINYIRAMHHGLARLADLPVCTRLITELHAELMREVRGQERNPGEVRRSQNWIGHGGCNLSDASFVPPPPHEVPSALSDLEKFVHSESPLPDLIKIGLIHVQFETIHPFLDGNGRVGRLLITLLLCARGILSQPVLYISHYFKRHRAAYYEHLQAVRDDGSWEAWLKFFLRGVAEVSGEATLTSRQIVSLRERHRQVIVERLGRSAGNGLLLLEHLFSHPVVSVNDVARRLNVTHAGANQIVGRMEQIGILTEMTGRTRNRAFRYGDYIDLFQ